MLFFRVFSFKDYVFYVSVFGGVTKFKYRKDYVLIWLFGSGIVGSVEIFPEFHVERERKMLAHVPQPIFRKRNFSCFVRCLFRRNILKNSFGENHKSICY